MCSAAIKTEFKALLAAAVGVSSNKTTPHCLGHLVLVRSLWMIHTSHQSLEQMYWFSKSLEGPFLRPLRSKDIWGWMLRLWPQNFLSSCESLAINFKKVRQTSVWQIFPKIWFFFFFLIVHQRLITVRNISKSNKSGLWNHFLRLAAKVSELPKKFQGNSFKIQPRTSSDLNGLKHDPSKQFESSLKSIAECLT